MTCMKKSKKTSSTKSTQRSKAAGKKKAISPKLKISKLNLPKGRLSWSQFNLWVRSPDQYRREYYYGVKRQPSDEMRFGDAIAKMMQAQMSGPIIDKIPRLSVPEHEILVDVNGVEVLAFIDSFEPGKLPKFREYKTGHADKKGNPPWDAVKVRKHGQLPFYATVITAKYGSCASLCYLDWIETEREKVQEDFGGEFIMDGQGKLRLTGRIESFPRKIEKWEITLMQNEILRVAKEISKDFTLFEKGMLG